jgi:hypothetical protein
MQPGIQTAMRAAFTFAGLLIAMFIVIKLSGRQVEALAPAGAAPASARASAVAAELRSALEAAAARASDAEGR